MSRPNNNPSSNTWHASDPYLMRIAAASFPWAPGAPPGSPTMPPHHHQTHSTHHTPTHGRSNNPVDTINSHHSAAAAAAHHSAHAAAMWSQSPGPFGILPHQENAPTNGTAGYSFSRASALHHRHHQGQNASAENAFALAYMNTSDANYSRFVNMNIGMNMLTAAAARSNSSASSSRVPHQQQVHPHHHPHHYHHHHPQYPSFPGSADRLARDFMNASAASYSGTVQQSPNASGVVDPCAASSSAVIMPPWYSTLPRMSDTVMNSPRMSSSNHSHHTVHPHHNNQRSNSSAAAPARRNTFPNSAYFASWPSYPNAPTHPHGQVNSNGHQMHQASAKYSSVSTVASTVNTPYQGTNGPPNVPSGSSVPGNHSVSRTPLPSVNCPPSGSNFNNYLSTQYGNVPLIGAVNPSAAPSLPSIHSGSSSTNVMNTNGNTNNGNNYANVTDSHVMTSTPVASNNNSNASSGSGSRSSSVASNHGVQVANSSGSGQGDTSNSCSYSNYNSPSANSVHAYSRYPRSNTDAAGTTSHTPKPVTQGNNVTDPLSGYNTSGNSGSLYNNSNGQSVSTGGYGAMQTTSRVSPHSSGYPTPPASVTMVSGGTSDDQSQGVVTPGDDPSHGMYSHFPLTPQSSSSYYSSSSGYSSSSKCSSDSVISGSSVSASSNNSSSNSNNSTSNATNSYSNSSCMVAAAAAAAAAAAVGNYVNHMPSVPTGENTGINDGSNNSSSSQQSSSMVGSCGRASDHCHLDNNPNPGPVSISDGQADPTLVSVHTEQEIDFPCISYPSEEGQNFNTHITATSGPPSASINGVKINGALGEQCTVASASYKKRKDRTRKKEKKEKVKQLAAADRLAPVADQMLSSTFAGAFDVAPIIPTSMVTLFELHNSMQFNPTPSLEQVTNGINPYVLGIDHSHAPLMLPGANGANINSVGPVDNADAACFSNDTVNHHMATLAPGMQSDQSNQQSQQHQQGQQNPQNQQQSDSNSLTHHQSMVQTSDLTARSQQVSLNASSVEKDSLSDLEDDLRLLTEGANSCSNGNSASSSHVNASQSNNELPDIRLSDFSATADLANQLHHSYQRHFTSADASSDSNMLASVASLEHANGVSGVHSASSDLSSAVDNMQGVKIDADDLIEFMNSTESATALECSAQQQLQEAPLPMDTSDVAPNDTFIATPVTSCDDKKVKVKKKKKCPTKVTTGRDKSKDVKSPPHSNTDKSTHLTKHNGQSTSDSITPHVDVAPLIKVTEKQVNSRTPKHNSNLIGSERNSSNCISGNSGQAVSIGKSKSNASGTKISGQKASSKKRKLQESDKVFDKYEFTESPDELSPKKVKGKSNHLHASSMPVDCISSQQATSKSTPKRTNHMTNGHIGQLAALDIIHTPVISSSSMSSSNSSSLLNTTPIDKVSSQNLITKASQERDHKSNHGTRRSDQPSQSKLNYTNEGSTSLDNSSGKVSTQNSRSNCSKMNSKHPETSLITLANVECNVKSSKADGKTNTAQENSRVGESVISRESARVHPASCKLQPLNPNDNGSSSASQSKSVKASSLQSQNQQISNASQKTLSQENKGGKSSPTGTKVACNSTSSVPAAITSSMGSSSRRRSQDKKTLTVREGLMRTSDFVVSMDEMNLELPMIWRIEGKSLLQRFEPTQQDGMTVYTNTNSYSAWNPTVKQRYRGVDVRIMGQTRKVMIVEKLGLTKSSPSNANINANSSSSDKFNRSNDQCEVSSNDQYQAPFEVFLQTLISQTLDPNFIAEIVEEQDDYFLSKVQMIEEICSRKKARFLSRVKWDASIVKCIESYPVVEVTSQKNENDLRCRLCHDAWSSQMFSFSGPAYDMLTLEEKETNESVKQTKYASCDSCKERVKLFSRLHHYKYNFYLKCQKKVEEMRNGCSDKESHVILAQCLDDQDWMELMFKEMDKLWCLCDQCE